MRAVEKIWFIVEQINEARGITPSGQPCILQDRPLHNVLTAIEIDSILEKLEKDEKVIKIIQKPHWVHIRSSNAYSKPKKKWRTYYEIEVLPDFDAYRDKTYTEFSFGVDQLDGLSLLRVYDVVLDVQEELQMTDSNQVTIRIIPPLVRYQVLFPFDGITQRDEYCRHRWNAMQFLKKIGAFTDCELDEGMGHRWDTLARIKVNRIEFDKAHEKLQAKYRTEFGKKKQEELLPRPTFDTQKGAILFKGKSCEIEIGSVEYYICLLTFEDFGEKIEELKVIDKAGKTDTKRVVYDAQRRLNEKVSKELGIPQLFGYGAARVWVRAEQFEPVNELKKEPESVSHM